MTLEHPALITDAQAAINTAAETTGNFNLNLDTKVDLNLSGRSSMAPLMLEVKGVRKKIEAVFLPKLGLDLERGVVTTNFKGHGFEVPQFEQVEFPDSAAGVLLSLLSEAVVEVPTRKGLINDIATSSRVRKFIGGFDKAGSSLALNPNLLQDYLERAAQQRYETQAQLLAQITTPPLTEE